MGEVKLDAIQRQIKARQFSPVYALHGEEPYYIDKIADLIEAHCLSDSERSFNQHILYGRETDAMTLLDVCMRYPMMAERQLVILREAQAMRDLEAIQSYVEKPAPTTVLVICYRGSKLDGRKKFTTVLKSNGTIVYSPKIRDYQMPDWIESYVKGRGISIDSRTAVLIEEHLGNDLARVVSSLDLLIDNLGEAKTIGGDLVQKFIGISKDYNSFELNNALLKRDRVKAFRVVDYFASNPKAGPSVVVMGGLYSLFSKLYLLSAMKTASSGEVASALGVNPYFVKDYKAALGWYDDGRIKKALNLLHRYDARLKGIDDAGTDDGELIREMVWQILN